MCDNNGSLVSTDTEDFELTWTGADGSFQEEEYPTLELAQARANVITENGGHSVTIADEDGNVFDF